ncbi:phage distal tail protein [Mycolicibacterium sp. PDY-3]|uniref:phage distal tail protein n=1 Tax=Mycolicibacterium sp. PDY-3 TaxID=3376069 RepID=UPI0037A048F3
MINLTIGDLVVIANGVPTSGYLLQTPIEGLDGPERRLSTYARSGFHGLRASSHKYGGRIINLVGSVYSDTSFAEFEERRKALIAATAINYDSGGRETPVRVSFTTMAGQDYYIDCYFDKPDLPLEQPVQSSFQIVGTSVDPFIYAATGVTSAAIRPPSGGGFVIPFVLPFVSAAATGGSVVLNNAGSEIAWPVITLSGPLTTPVITNATTGTYLQLAYTIGTGDQVIIDMHPDNRSITVNGASLISTKTDTSDWWSLPPGNSAITLTTTNTGDTGSMVVAFNPPSVGV